ncbi:MAG: hypothetical protein QG593_644 [Patescibacteria group bacterium]|nr:hypothetical protein [Patescibacteria group bacterium]
MAYVASNIQYNKNQLMVISMAMFGAVAAAIVVSTLLVLSLMRNEFASAVSELNTNAPVAQTISTGSDVCTGTSSPQVSEGSAVQASSVAKKHWNGSVNNSYNNTNTSTSQVTNNVNETTTTNNTLVNTVTDSFNLGSYNQVASNNTVNSNNTVETNINPNNSVNVNSNNTTTVDSHDVAVEVELEIEDSVVVGL